MEVLLNEIEAIAALMGKYNIEDILFAQSDAQKKEIWKLRRGISEAVTSNSVSKEQDTVVPRAELPLLVRGIKKIGEKWNFKSVCYGHAGDGNLHIRIIKGHLSDEQWNGQYIKNAISEIFVLCKELKGTISGEHGIGLVQQDYMGIVFSEKALNIQREIKRVFDPNNILNPGKMFGVK